MNRLDAMAQARRRAETVARMRSLARASGASTTSGQPQAAQERCDVCNTPLPDDHRHLLQLEERRIVCACEACWALHSGDAEYRPVGTRTVWLDEFDLDDQLWASFQIPIALAFLMRSTVTGGVVAFYPSPAGATESELSLEAWEELVARNPVLEGMDPDAEALIVNRLDDPSQFVIAPIDQCYALVGLIKVRWEGISGGPALREAVPEFFAALRDRTNQAPRLRPPPRAQTGP
jgi:Family of unknown function (DUF5947)